MKIVITKNLGLYPDQKERLENLGDVMYYGTECSSPDEWYDRCKDADIICTGRIGLGRVISYGRDHLPDSQENLIVIQCS